jgi:hypothetical protein
MTLARRASSLAGAAMALARRAKAIGGTANSMADDSISMACRRRSFVDPAVAMAEPRKTKGDRPNEERRPPIEYGDHGFYFTRNATARRKAPCPAFVDERKRTSTTVPEGMTASEVLACSVDASSIHVLPPSLLHSQSYDARAAAALATTCTVPDVEPCVTPNGALRRAEGLRIDIPALVIIASAFSGLASAACCTHVFAASPVLW